MRHWTPRQWSTAAIGTVLTALVIGIPTDVIPNPVFGRPVAVTWWSPLVLGVTAVLAGLLLASYVRDPAPAELTAPGGLSAGGAGAQHDGMRTVGVGGLLAFFAVGCPVCNQVVVLALGTSGALAYFAPVQPLLAVVSMVLLAWALRRRLAGAKACAIG